MKTDDFVPVSCSECGNKICQSDCFLDDIIASPRDYLKDKTALKKGHILCDDCFVGSKIDNMQTEEQIKTRIQVLLLELSQTNNFTDRVAYEKAIAELYKVIESG